MATRIPINKDNYSFEDRQKKIWEDMEKDMERRRREWEDEIHKMRKEFFLLNPDKSEFPPVEGAPRANRIAAPIQDSEDGKPVIEKDEKGLPVFRVRFNMTDYKPEEINVKMDSTKIMVSAKHEEKGGGSSVSREYNREVNIPKDVDPLALSCTLNPDGYLVFHAPLPAPNYNAIKDSSSGSQNSPGVVKSTSSFQSSTINRGGGGPFGNTSVPTPVYSQREVQQKNQQQQQQQQSRVQSINQQPQAAPKQTNYNQQSSYNQSSQVTENPDIVVPSFKPPPDLSKYDIVDKPTHMTSQFQAAPSLHSAPPHFNTAPASSHFNTASQARSQASPAFGAISSTFPSGPISSQAQLSTPVITSQDGKFQLTMPIDDFKPEELTVKTQDGKVIICAKRQVCEGNRNKTVEMTREHSLPDNVDPVTVKAFFTDTNKLIVEAPFLRS